MAVYSIGTTTNAGANWSARVIEYCTVAPPTPIASGVEVVERNTLIAPQPRAAIDLRGVDAPSRYLVLGPSDNEAP